MCVYVRVLFFAFGGTENRKPLAGGALLMGRNSILHQEHLYVPKFVALLGDCQVAWIRE